MDFHTFLREVFTKNYEKKLPQILAYVMCRVLRCVVELSFPIDQLLAL